MLKMALNTIQSINHGQRLEVNLALVRKLALHFCLLQLNSLPIDYLGPAESIESADRKLNIALLMISGFER